MIWLNSELGARWMTQAMGFGHVGAVKQIGQFVAILTDVIGDEYQLVTLYTVPTTRTRWRRIFS